ncbi:MAG TPA: thioredoxin domain-containing protein, partial [Ktedonobacter sp.]|nr:thioredoxin domain-containing protein [Ktedonobacter sp.]
LGHLTGADTASLLEVINRRYLPNSVLARADPADSLAVQTAQTVQAVPLLADRPLKDGKATAYVCQNFTCLAPVNTAEELERLL